MTQLTRQPYTLPGAPLGGENPLPYFRHPAPHARIGAHPSLPEEKRALLGYECGFRVLPYRVQDQYSRARAETTFEALVLENEHLRATFLPQVGGRLVSLVDLNAGRELLHRNPVFQPADLAIRNAWFSGGIEWNIGQYGHTFTTCSPVFAARIEGPEGSPGLRLYEFERAHGLFWQVDFALPPGLPFLLAYARVINPHPRPTSMYWWTNIAVDEREGVRVLAPAETAIYPDPEGGFGLAAMPQLPGWGGKDASYSLNAPKANEQFFQCDAEMPFEAALDAQGYGLVDASTPRLKYRKMFVWGTHGGGRHWQEYLSRPGEAYLEIQAGLAPSQVHGLIMPAAAEWDWTQAFSALQVEPAAAHDPDWNAAWRFAEAALRQKITPEALRGLEEDLRSRRNEPPAEIFQHGSAWGALELARGGPDLALVTVSFTSAYPADEMGPEQDRWLNLLETGIFPEPDPGEAPGEWMTQREWEAPLAKAARGNWFALLHLGVMRLEHFDEAGARAAWEESLRLKPSAWAHRCLAQLDLRQRNRLAALAHYEQAFALLPSQGAIAREYLQLLYEMGLYQQGVAVYRALSSGIQADDRVQILRARLALKLGLLDEVQEALAREFALVREGEVALTDLWFEMHARREAQATGRPLTEDLFAEVKQKYPPPAAIDFRMHAE